MNRINQLIKEVKAIIESEAVTNGEHETDESGEQNLDEMARKAYNNTLTEKGKKDITAAVKKMIAEEKEGKAEHSKGFVFKVLAKLAKMKVGDKITTTELQEIAGVKHPQPMNKLLQSLQKAEYLERATSHVEPEPKEPGKRGRPADPNKPAKEKKEKVDKYGGLNIKPEKSTTDSAEDSDKEEGETKVVTENEEQIDEIDLMKLEKSLISQFGMDGNKEKVDEKDLGQNETSLEPLQESIVMKFKRDAGIISDSEYAAYHRKQLLK